MLTGLDVMAGNNGSVVDWGSVMVRSCNRSTDGSCSKIVRLLSFFVFVSFVGGSSNLMYSGGATEKTFLVDGLVLGGLSIGMVQSLGSIMLNHWLVKGAFVDFCVV